MPSSHTPTIQTAGVQEGRANPLQHQLSSTDCGTAGQLDQAERPHQCCLLLTPLVAESEELRKEAHLAL